MILEEATALKEDKRYQLLKSKREGNPLELAGIPQGLKAENDRVPRIQPQELKYDRQDL